MGVLYMHIHRLPCPHTGVRNNSLQTKECLGAAALALSQIENRYDQRAGGDFEQPHQKHRKRCQREDLPVRFDVPEQSSEIAHRFLRSFRSVGAREGLNTAVLNKK